MIVAVPEVEPVNWTLQVELGAALELRTHDTVEGETYPVTVKLTLPVGAEAPVPDVSVREAVQVLAWPAITGEPQLTDVVVFRLLTVRANGEAVLLLML